MGINSPAVTIKNIENAIIDYAWDHGWIVPELPAIRTGKKIAVVGSGPAGLAAAAQLNKVSYFSLLHHHLPLAESMSSFIIYTHPLMK